MEHFETRRWLIIIVVVVSGISLVNWWLLNRIAGCICGG